MSDWLRSLRRSDPLPAPDTPERRRQVRASFADRSRAVAQRYRNSLAEWYGKEQAAAVGHAEAFEICEYGRQPKPEEIKVLFPFFP